MGRVGVEQPGKPARHSAPDESIEPGNLDLFGQKQPHIRGIDLAHGQ